MAHVHQFRDLLAASSDHAFLLHHLSPAVILGRIRTAEYLIESRNLWCFPAWFIYRNKNKKRRMITRSPEKARVEEGSLMGTVSLRCVAEARSLFGGVLVEVVNLRVKRKTTRPR